MAPLKLLYIFLPLIFFLNIANSSAKCSSRKSGNNVQLRVVAAIWSLDIEMLVSTRNALSTQAKTISTDRFESCRAFANAELISLLNLFFFKTLYLLFSIFFSFLAIAASLCKRASEVFDSIVYNGVRLKLFLPLDVSFIIIVVGAYACCSLIANSLVGTDDG